MIAGRCRVSLDVRHADDALRMAAVDRLRTMAHEIAARRGLALDWSARFEHPATAMDGSLTAMLTRAVERTGVPATTISSGAGHDAMIVAAYMPAAMLFIRTPGGVSHHPDESVTEEDVTAALAAGGTFLDEMASAAGG